MDAKIIGWDEITQGIRENDAMSNVRSIDRMLEELGVDANAAQQVSRARAAMMLALLNYPRGGAGQLARAALSTAWLDGFACAMHVREQREKPPNG